MPTPELKILLDKYDITWEQFSKKGRPPPGIVEKRSNVVTELHEAGTPWTEMCRITGLTLGAINRLSKASWNPASKANRQASAAKVARSRKGEIKPWLTTQLKKSWEEGKYEFLRSRIRPEEELERQRHTMSTPEYKAKRRAQLKTMWENAEFRDRLIGFHRSKEERVRRSALQAQRMLDNPRKWSRGIGAEAQVQKEASRSVIWTRSSYERIAIKILDNDMNVISYIYEMRIELLTGKWALPDFIVSYADGSTTLLEIKASWALKMPPEHKVSLRLKEAENYALSKGWNFEVWTEKDRLKC